MIERPKPAEMWDKDGIYLLFFDDVTEEKATEIIVRNLINGIPEETIVSQIPDFLAREIVTV